MEISKLYFRLKRIFGSSEIVCPIEVVLEVRWFDVNAFSENLVSIVYTDTVSDTIETLRSELSV